MNFEQFTARKRQNAIGMEQLFPTNDRVLGRGAKQNFYSWLIFDMLTVIFPCPVHLSCI